MDSWRFMTVIVLLQLTIIIIQAQSRSPENDALQLVIPGKGHVQWLPHHLRPPLQEIHSITTSALHRRNRRQNDEQLNATIGEHAGNLTETVAPNLPRRGFISDKEIVVIVVCSSIGLVICLLGAAISAKYYWKKVGRDSGGNYHGVLQKDTSGLSDDTSGIQTHREKDGRLGHANMFAQIDEMDEEGSCPSSPTTTTKDKVIQNGGEIKVSVEASPSPALGNVKDDRESVEIQAEDKLEELVSETPELLTTTVEVEVLTNDSSSLNGEVEPPRVYCRTGLSQSDCSLSSYTSVNPTYKYGNQVAYMAGYYGYPCIIDDLISPCDMVLPLTTLLAPPVGSKHFDFPIPKEDLDMLLSTDDAGASLRESPSPAIADDVEQSLISPVVVNADPTISLETT